MIKVQKYNEDQEQEMYALYTAAETHEERAKVVEFLATKYRKNTRMITAKLSKMDIYITVPRVSKVTGVKPETKEQMVRRLEKKFDWPSGDFAGLEKCPKVVLQKLLGEFTS